jgi:DNA-binding transcriptional MerR regulator
VPVTACAHVLLALDLRANSKVYGAPVDQTISVLAKRFGVRPDTLRYYDRLGLVRPTGRSTAGYRLYDETSIERMEFIRGAQRMGLRLSDVKELLEVRDRGQCPCGHTKVLVERRLAEVSAEIRQLSAVRRQLVALKKRNEECIEVSPLEWSCFSGVAKGGET